MSWTPDTTNTTSWTPAANPSTSWGQDAAQATSWNTEANKSAIRTIAAGSPIGLLLALTYSAIVSINLWTQDNSQNDIWVRDL